MRVRVLATDGVTVLADTDRVPECGRDFCDRCGDCLACYAGEACPRGCVWLMDVEVHADRITAHAIPLPAPPEPDAP